MTLSAVTERAGVGPLYRHFPTRDTLVEAVYLTLADVIASAHKGAAEGMAAHLPPAPRCPL